jgi:hypothetical protein
MQDHTLSAFDEQLKVLDADLAEMGRMAWRSPSTHSKR